MHIHILLQSAWNEIKTDLHRRREKSGLELKSAPGLNLYNSYTEWRMISFSYKNALFPKSQAHSINVRIFPLTASLTVSLQINA